MHESPDAQTTFGYLSALESPDHGCFGGYLIVSQLGRPLEFHCTAPVLPNRAQQILYGATLASYLFGELIGGTLLAAAKSTPALILTDKPEFGPLGQKVTAPLVLAGARSAAANEFPLPRTGCCEVAASTEGRDRNFSEHPEWGNAFVERDYVLQLAWSAEKDVAAVAELLQILLQRVDLLEPFERIHEAIREAQRIGTRSHDNNAHAA